MLEIPTEENDFNLLFFFQFLCLSDNLFLCFHSVLRFVTLIDEVRE